jgi:hypothetical protein
MHKKFEEFVLGKSGLDSMERVVANYCPGVYGLWETDPCPDDCNGCWENAGARWVKDNVFETTTEAPTEDGQLSSGTRGVCGQSVGTARRAGTRNSGSAPSSASRCRGLVMENKCKLRMTERFECTAKKPEYCEFAIDNHGCIYNTQGECSCLKAQILSRRKGGHRR